MPTKVFHNYMKMATQEYELMWYTTPLKIGFLAFFMPFFNLLSVNFLLAIYFFFSQTWLKGPYIFHLICIYFNIIHRHHKYMHTLTLIINVYLPLHTSSSLLVRVVCHHKVWRRGLRLFTIFQKKIFIFLTLNFMFV